MGPKSLDGVEYNRISAPTSPPVEGTKISSPTLTGSCAPQMLIVWPTPLATFSAPCWSACQSCFWHERKMSSNRPRFLPLNGPAATCEMSGFGGCSKAVYVQVHAQLLRICNGAGAPGQWGGEEEGHPELAIQHVSWLAHVSCSLTVPIIKVHIETYACRPVRPTKAVV